MFQILGTGSSLPKLKVTNDDLAKKMDTSDEWIVSKTGIKSRNILSDETITDLAVEASIKAIKDAKVDVSEIDLIVSATLVGDTITPSMSCLIAEKLGVSCPAFDINAACSGFVYALDVVAGYFARKKVKKVLVLGAERLSHHIDWSDRATCVLFGDGAGAVVLGEGDNLRSIRLTTQPGKANLYEDFRGGDSPFSTREFPVQHIKMNGQEVYKFAVNAIVNDIKFVLDDAKITQEKVSHFLLHQANIRIIDAAIHSLKIPKEKFHNTIDHTGNLSAASIPVLLDEINKAGKLKRGDLIAICAFGAGLTTGAMLMEW
ncbi:MAG: ketoacyl-ACP synthase III [Firmicutes bacterium]|nr:ketoacyl-ACP synthase III [Bacillota bacterium]